MLPICSQIAIELLPFCYLLAILLPDCSQIAIELLPFCYPHDRDSLPNRHAVESILSRAKGEPFEPQIWRASLAPSLEQEKRFSLLK